MTEQIGVNSVIERIDATTSTEPENVPTGQKSEENEGVNSIGKATNPKDAVAIDKLPLHLVPDTLPAYAALAFYEGALKYGAYNWRVAGARVSVYKSALDRHAKKFFNGEWADVKTGVPHLASMAASIGVLIDAFECRNVVDDRPPKQDMAITIATLEKHMPHLQELFKDFSPHQYTEEEDGE